METGPKDKAVRRSRRKPTVRKIGPREQTASALDVLPTKKGQAPKPYVPAKPSKTLVRKVNQSQARGDAKEAVDHAMRVAADIPRRIETHPKKGSSKILRIGKGILAAPGDVINIVYGTGSGDHGGSRAATSSLGGVPMVATGGPAKVAKNVGFAIAEDPKHQVPKLATDTAKSVIAIPAGLADFATHPKRSVEAMAKDYARRYGDLAKGPDGERRFRERLRKEGVAPEVMDLAAGLSTGGATVGRAAQTAAKAGVLGKAAERIAGQPRRLLRVSGGEAVEQPLSRNLGRNAVRKAKDSARAKVQAARAAREDAPAIVREAQARGEVTPIRLRKADKQARRQVARRKGLAVQRMKAEQHAEVHAGAARNLSRLSKREQDAFAYAMKLGLPADSKVAVRRLVKHRDDIKVERAKRPDLHVSKHTDELPVIDRLIAEADKGFTDRVGQVVKVERKRAERVALGDPGVDPVQAQLRRYAPQAEHLGVVRKKGETNAQFLRRVKQAAKQEGLQRPGYFASEKRPEGVFSTFAVGGTKAIQAPKAYTGELFRTGRENTAADAYTRGIAQNIKRKYNWNTVADNFEAHSFDWGRDKTIGELKDELERRGIDPGSVAFWNPRKYRDLRKNADGLNEPDMLNEPGNPHLQDALTHSTLSGMSSVPSDFKSTKGWAVVPKTVYDEIMADTRPSGKYARSWDVAKGKASRVLLANPAWLQFQVASNALLTGLAGTGPIDVVKAQAWWRRLSPAERDAIEPYIGVARWYDDQTHLGASANNRMVNAYRAMKRTSFYQQARKANPLDLLFRGDNAQNNAFRKAVLYSQAKRDAYRRMGQNAAAMQKLQDRIAGLFTLGPKEQLKAVVRDQRAIEQHAQHVLDFLGDYSTYTASERRLLGRSVMFYGFLRYSLKFTFYTMPVGHPIMSSILAQVGRLHTEELQRLFGQDVEVPPWEWGSYFTADGATKIPLARLNPFVNASQYVDFGSNRLKPESVVSFLPPFVQMAFDQVAGKNVAFDRPFTVDGSGSYVMKAGELGASQRARILVSDVLNLSPAYRVIEKTGLPGVDPLAGKQTDTSSLLFPDPVVYSTRTADSRKRAAENREDARRELARPVLREELLPLAGQEGTVTIRKARRFAEDQKPKPKRKVRRIRGFGGGGFDSGFGGGGFDSGF